MAIKLEPKKFSELSEVTSDDGEALLPIVSGADNEVIKTKNLPLSDPTKTYVDATSGGKLIELNVRVAADLAGVLRSDVVYFIDGIIDMGTQTITVPAGGLTIRGLGFNVSQLVSAENAYTMFVDTGTAGDLFISELSLDVSGTTSKVFDLDNQGNSNAVELNKVNFNNCTSLGSLDEYRQFLASNLGLFDCKDGLEFIGTWEGARIETAIVRDFLTGGTVFKAGTALSFTNRFVTNINMDIPAGASGIDFADTNFVVDGDFELLGANFTGAGDFLPNIESTNVKSRFRNCAGIRNTYVGAQWTLTSESTTTIGTVDTPVKVAGTTVYIDEQWFSNLVDNAFIFDSSDPIEVEVKGTLSFTGGANDQINVIIRQWDDSASSYINLSETGPQTMSQGGGGNRAENISILGYATIAENDRIEIWVENQSDSSNITCKLGGLVSVEERAS